MRDDKLNKYKYFINKLGKKYLKENDESQVSVADEILSLIGSRSYDAAGKKMYELRSANPDLYKSITNEIVTNYKKGIDKDKINSYFINYFTKVDGRAINKMTGTATGVGEDPKSFLINTLSYLFSGMQDVDIETKREMGLDHIQYLDALGKYQVDPNALLDTYIGRLLGFAIQEKRKIINKGPQTVSMDQQVGGEEGGKTIGDTIEDEESAFKVGNIDYWDESAIDIPAPSSEELGDLEDLAPGALTAEKSQKLYNAVKTVQKMASEYLNTITDPKVQGWANWYEDNTLEGEEPSELINNISNWNRYDFKRAVYHNWIKQSILPEYIGKKLGIVIPGVDLEAKGPRRSLNVKHMNTYLNKLSKSTDDGDKRLYSDIEELYKGILGKNQDVIADVNKFVSGDNQMLLKLITMGNLPKGKLSDYIKDQDLLESLIETARGFVNGGAYNKLKLTNINKTNSGAYDEGWVSRNRDKINALVDDETFEEMMNLSVK